MRLFQVSVYKGYHKKFGIAKTIIRYFSIDYTKKVGLPDVQSRCCMEKNGSDPYGKPSYKPDTLNLEVESA